MRIKTIIATMLLVIGLGQSAFAAQWKIDKAHSAIYFDIKHIFSTTRGFFSDYEGMILFDPENPGAAKIEMTVKAASVDTAITKRDNHLRSKDFFEIETYPDMTFVSTEVMKSGEGKFMVSGKLTVKGKTTDIKVPMTFMGPSEHPLKKGENVVGMDFRMTFDRIDLGVGNGKFYEMGVLDRKVDLFVTLEMLD